ncbi:MAG: UDP-3-O-acyl-N-acetylglucosamine deacetylase, partial [Pseudomonadota bacterium]
SRRFVGARQTTIAREIQLNGTGVHSGAPVSLVLHPAGVDVGLRFLVTRRGQIIAEIPAHVQCVKNLTLCTVIGDEDGTTVGTVEHLLAAIRGMGIDNCIIEIEGKEVPIMDGSSSVFVDAIEAAGVKTLSAPRRFLKVLKPVRVETDTCWGEIVPHHGFRLETEIAFDTPVIGRQRLAMELTPDSFRDELKAARTFGFMADVEKLWKCGLALGASLDNSVAIEDDKVLNEGGLRYANEFVRHKMLDAVGDLTLAGNPILGCYRSFCGGHRLNANVLQALFADRSAWTMVDAPAIVRDDREIARAPISFTASAVMAGE